MWPFMRLTQSGCRYLARTGAFVACLPRHFRPRREGKDVDPLVGVPRDLKYRHETRDSLRADRFGVTPRASQRSGV